MRLIDVDALPNYKLMGIMTFEGEKSPAELRIVLWEDIESMPIVEAVPVVRCRECVYKNTTACPAYDAPFMRTSLRIKFCSEGQRREDGHEQ